MKSETALIVIVSQETGSISATSTAGINDANTFQRQMETMNVRQNPRDTVLTKLTVQAITANKIFRIFWVN